MHTGKSYKLSEFLFWTRRSILWLLLVGTIPTVLYEVFDVKWISVPWSVVVALLGTATAFIVGFKMYKPIIVHGKLGRYGELR